MNIVEAILVWRDLGVFSYVLPYLIIFFLSFLVLFAVVSKGKISKDKEINFLISIIVSGFISNFMALLGIQFGILYQLAMLFENIILVLISGILLVSIVLWIYGLVDIIRKSNKKAIMIISLILGSFFSGWAYLMYKQKSS